MMTTPRDLFEMDSKKNERISRTEKLQINNSESIEVTIALNNDLEACVSYGFLYIEESPFVIMVINYYLDNPHRLLELGNVVEIEERFRDADEILKSSELSFSGRIFVYTASCVPQIEKKRLTEKARTKKLNLIIRDGSYLAKRAETEEPLAFISHDSRDKDDFVRDLAINLTKMYCPVWYDEYSLIPGQSLRASIEEGIKKCRKCILVISQNFINNEGWTKAEFDSIFTREIIEKTNVIIPVWYGVTKREVYEYSPRMADRVAVSSDLGVEEVARRLFHVIKS